MKITEQKFRKYGAYALVTGAASGMGRLYSLKLAKIGYNVVMVDINAAKLEETAQQIRSEVASLSDWRAKYKGSFKLLPVVYDLSKQDAAQNIAALTREAGCEVEVLVNNAGLFFFQSIAQTSRQRLSLMMMVHNYTPLMLCREYVPDMIARGRGYVLNISSLAAWMAWPGVGMYADTKCFIKAYSRSLRVECRGTGVSVTTAYFGAVDTPLYNLKDNLRKLAHRLGVMISAEKATDCALKATFKRRKSCMPGLINHIAKPFVVLFPDSLLQFCYKKLDFLRMDV